MVDAAAGDPFGAAPAADIALVRTRATAATMTPGIGDDSLVQQSRRTMIKLEWNNVEGQIGALMSRFNELPRHIAKKHLLAVIKRAGKDGVAILKANTPKGRTRSVNGTRVRGGALRRAVTVKSKYQGRNADGYAYGVLGYKYGPESRKAIWLEFGTSRGIRPRRMIANTMSQWGGPAKSKLVAELVVALEKATKEMASGKNPTRIYSAGGSWRPG